MGYSSIIGDSYFWPSENKTKQVNTKNIAKWADLSSTNLESFCFFVF